MNASHSTAVIALAALNAAAHALPTEILARSDYMSSGFFQSDFLRGEEANSNRAVNRVTSPTIFGVTGETTYFSFDFNPLAFTGPIPQALVRVETVANGFFPDPNPANPAEISLHRLTADPLAVIDQDLAAGPGSWLNFRDTQITTASIISTVSIDAFGVVEWDITTLINEWITNGDANFAYTIGTSALLDPQGSAAVGFINSSSATLGSQLTARITIVPASGSVGLLALGGLLAARRRR